MTRKYDPGLFPRLIEEWNRQRDAAEAARAFEAARALQATQPAFDADRTRKKFFVELAGMAVATIGVFVNYAMFIICFG